MYRITADYRPLNQHLVELNYPLEDIESLLYKLAQAKSVTLIDISSAFFHLPLSEESQKYLIFQAYDEFLNKNLYRITRLGQGTSQSSSLFQAAMAKILGKLDENLKQLTVSYVDDLSILHLTEDPKREIDILDKILGHLEQCGIKINLKKMQVMKKSFLFLGHMIQNNKISVCPKRLSGIKNLRAPTNKKELQILLGHVNYIRKHVPNLHNSSAVLYKKLDQIETDGDLDEEGKMAYNKLLESLTNSINLNFPTPKAPMVMFSDASDYAIATFLCQFSKLGKYLSESELQEIDWNKLEEMSSDIVIHPLGCSSKSLNKSERNAPIALKELIALCYSLINNRELLHSGPIFVLIDSQTLFNWLTGTSEINTTIICAKRVVRLINRIQSLCATPKVFKLIKSKCNLSDVYSRLVKKDETTEAQQVNTVVTRRMQKTTKKDESKELPAGLASTLRLIPPRKHLKDISKWQRNDKELKILFKCIKKTEPIILSKVKAKDLKVVRGWFKRKATKIKIKNQVLYFEDIWRDETIERIFIPRNYTGTVLYMLHDYNSHIGINALKGLYNTHFFTPRANKLINNYVRSCYACVVKNFPRSYLKSKDSKMLDEIKDDESRVVYLDHVFCYGHSGPVILTAVDAMTNFCIAAPCKDVSAVELIRVLAWQIIPRFLFVDRFISDNGKSFRSTIYTNFLNKLGIKYKFIAPLNPRANLSEHRNKILKKIIQAENITAKEFGPLINWIILRLNSVYDPQIGCTPLSRFYKLNGNFTLTFDNIPTYENLGNDVDKKIYEKVAHRNYVKFIQRETRMRKGYNELKIGQKVVIYKNITVRPYHVHITGHLSEKLNSITYEIDTEEGKYIRTLRRIQILPERLAILEPNVSEIPDWEIK